MTSVALVAYNFCNKVKHFTLVFLLFLISLLHTAGFQYELVSAHEKTFAKIGIFFGFLRLNVMFSCYSMSFVFDLLIFLSRGISCCGKPLSHCA